MTTRALVGLLILVPFVGLGSAGCFGGQTGGEVGSHPPRDEDLGGSGGTYIQNPEDGPSIAVCVEECRDERTALELDEPSPLGFSPEDVLAVAEGTHEAALTYSSSQEGAFQLTPGGTSTTLTMVLERTGNATFVQSWPGPDSCYPADSQEICPDRLEVEVTVSLTTEDGAFDEQFAALLVAKSPGETTLTVPLDLESLAGSFAVEVDNDGKTALTTLDSVFAAGVFAGSVTGLLQLERDGSHAETGYVTFAHWGRGDCPDDAALVDPEAEGVLSSAEPFDTINQTSPLSLTWADGTQTELTLNASDSGGPLCRSFSRLVERKQEDFERYVIGGTIELATADGRWATTQPIEVCSAADAGELVTTSLYLAQDEPVPRSEFEATFGLRDVDLGDFETAGLRLDIAYTGEGDSGRAEGDVTVVGVLPNECVDTEDSTCGSPGWQELEVAKVGAQGGGGSGPDFEPL